MAMQMSDFGPDLRVATADELAAEISILLSADKRRAPILRGKATNRLQAEEHQRAFCEWVAGRLIESRRFVVLRSLSIRQENYFPTVHTSPATPPQRFAP